MVERNSPGSSLQNTRQMCISVFTFLCVQCLRLWQGATLLHHCLPCEFSAARWQNLFRRPKRHHVLVCDLRRLELEKNAVFFLENV